MTTFNRGDVVLIPFPFTDLSTVKQRPALIISSLNFNNSHDDVIAMAITSQIPKAIAEEDYLLSREEMELANLPKPSIVKTGKIVTINKVLIRKKLGGLPATTIDKIKTRFQNFL